MDAKEYALKRKRMCEYYGCDNCPLVNCCSCSIDGSVTSEEIDNIISIVENWEEPKSETYEESKKDMITIRDYFEELLTRVEAIEDRLNNLK